MHQLNYAIMQSIESRLISFCPVQLRSFCASCFVVIPFLYTASGRGLQELPGFLGSMVFGQAPIPRKGSENDNISSKTIEGIWSFCVQLLDEAQLNNPQQIFVQFFIVLYIMLGYQ